LKILEGYLNRDVNAIFPYIEEGRRIEKKMGYWSSMFNLPYFFNEYAEVLIQFDRFKEASSLLEEAVRYNPNFAKSYLNSAQISLKNRDWTRLREDLSKARELLADADNEYILAKELGEISKKSAPSSVPRD
jgi:tetratricopeptide (TPR) repeat protein